MVRFRVAPLLLAAALACSPRAATPAVRLPSRPVRFSLLEDYDKGEDLADVRRDFALFRQLGVRSWRGSFGWDDYEPEPGRYDFGWLQRFAATADSFGIELHPYIGYTPEWAAVGRTSDSATWNDPPRRLGDWFDFVTRLTGELRGHSSIASYEIYNEENTRLWWDGSAAEYDSVLGRAVQGIRQAAPGTPVIFGGMVWPDADWATTACRAMGVPPGAVAIHAYPETWTPDSVTVENYLAGLPAFLARVDGPCGHPAIWLNEIGFATTAGRSERDQAAWWVRAVATFLAEPRVEEIGVYEIKDLRPERSVIGEPPNYHLGLLYADGRPKLAFHTVSALIRLFGTDSLAVADRLLKVERTAGTGRIFAHLFRRDGGRWLLAAWTRDGDAVVRVNVAVPLPDSAHEIGLEGAEHTAAGWSSSGFRRLALSAGLPRLFLIGP